MPFLAAGCAADYVYITIHRISDKVKYPNFCDLSGYTRKVFKDRTEEFTFVFTDTDYQYAVEHPAPQAASE